MSEIKCGRCDRRYSSLKSRCPYCGARRNKHGKHSNDENNSTAKLLIGIVILILLIVAVIVLIFSSIKADSATNKKTDDNDVTASDGVNQDGVNGGEDIDTVDGTDPTGVTGDGSDATDEPDTTPEPDTTTQVQVTSVSITYLGSEKEDVTMSVGDKVDFDDSITPDDADVTVEWSSSDEDVFVVLQTGEVTAVGSGTATLTLTAGDKTAECLIRVG
jgi:DNA-directed RNA polymerase subunit RPC12/RpoP